MISKEAIEFMTFIKINSSRDSAYLDNPPMHYELADKLLSKDLHVLVEVFRGGAKTTLVEWLVVFIAFKGGRMSFAGRKVVRHIRWFSSTEDNLEDNMTNIADKIQKSVSLRPLIDEGLFYIDKVTAKKIIIKVPKYKDSLGNPYTLYVGGRSFSSKFRGGKIGDDRPQLIIVDDVLTTDMATSESKIKKAKATWTRDVYPMKDDNAKILYIGTPVSPKDIIADLEKNSLWKVHKFPVCEKFPCEKEEFKGHWEVKFPYEEVLQRYQLSSDDLGAFYQEYMLQPISQAGKLVQEGTLQSIPVSIIRNNLEHYNIYIATDFAYSSSNSADYTAIGVFAVDYRGAYILIDGILKKQLFTDTIDDLFNLVKKYTVGSRVPTVFLEKSGQQGGFISVLYKEQYTRQIMFMFGVHKDTSNKKDFDLNSAGIRPTTDKTARFVINVVPIIKNNQLIIGEALPGEYYFQKLIDELYEEVYNVSIDQGVDILKNDDVIDMLSILCSGKVIIPNVISQQDEEMVKKIKGLKEHYKKEYGYWLSDTEAQEIIRKQQSYYETLWGS